MTGFSTVLLDTNIIIDVFLQSQPFAQDADSLVLLIESGKLQASLCATSLPTIEHLLSGALGKQVARVTSSAC